MPETDEVDVRRLAQYRPFAQGGLSLLSVLSDLVLAAAAIDGGRIESLPACQTAFRELWGLDVEIGELRAVADHLVDRKLIVPVSNGFDLAPGVLAVLEQKANESDDIERSAFREWETSIRQTTSGLTDDVVEQLKSDLRTWLQQIIVRHGAEAALLLYPEEERARQFFDKVDSHGFDLLPDRGADCARLRAATLPEFVRAPTRDQRRYLAGLLNTSFYMSVLTIDPGARELVQEQVAGQRIYLDTNFLYPILGAAQPEEVQSARRLVKMSQELGFSFAVTPWTLDELRTSIQRSRREINQQRRFLRPELADTMLVASGDKGFNRLFWQTFKSTYTQPQDVFDRLEHFDKDLEKYGIVELDVGCDSVEEQPRRIRDYASLLNSERWPHQKEPVVLEHDAKCRLLIEGLRGTRHARLSTARCWFLTYDTKLPRFAQRVPDNGDEVPDLPFCVSPSTWLQITRALTPRTEEFDQTVVDLLTSPFVGYRKGVDFSVVREVVGRMDHFAETSPEMAVAVLTDSAKVSEIERAVATEDDEVVEEAVKIAYDSKARELREAVEQSERRVQEFQQALEDQKAESEASEARATRDRIAAEERATAAANRAADVESALVRQQREWEEQKGALEGRLEAVDGDRADAEDRLTAVEAQLARTQRRWAAVGRVALGVTLVAIGVAVALVLSLVAFDDRWAKVGSVVGGAAIAVLGVRIALGKRWSMEFYAFAGIVVALAAIATAIAVG